MNTHLDLSVSVKKVVLDKLNNNVLHNFYINNALLIGELVWKLKCEYLKKIDK